MFFKGVRKYGIRKLSVGVASIVVGLTTQLLMQPEVLADSVASSQMISFRYVIEDEVPSELKKSIQTHLTKTTVGDYQTYYLVYQEESKQSVLPKMNMQDASLILMTMGGVLIIGVTTVKGKRRKIITSIVLLTTLGSFPVQALTGVKLAGYNRQIELQVGQELPDMALKIEGYRFLGYLLQDKLPFNHLLTEQNLRVIDEDIVFDTQYRENSELVKGQEREIQSGKVGLKRTYYHLGNLTKEEIVRPAVNRIIEIGTKEAPVVPEKPSEPEKVITTREENIDFEIEYRNNPDLLKGEQREVQAGQHGIRRVTLTNGVVTNTEIVRPAVNRIIEIGTKEAPVVPEKPSEPEKVITTREENIDFEVEYRNNPDLLKGEQREVQSGQHGIRRVTLTNGVVTKEEIVRPAVNRIIEIGTKEAPVVPEKPSEPEQPIEPVVTIQDITKPFTIKTEIDSTLWLGEERMIQSGQDGIVRQTLTDGKVTGEQIIQPMIEKIINVGSKTVDKLPLDNLYRRAKDLTPSDYSITSWQNVANLFDGVKALLANQSHNEIVYNEVVAQTQALQKALDSLSVDKTQLIQSIEQAEQKLESAYTTDSWQRFSEQLKVSQEVLANNNVKQSQINQENELLQQAVQALIPIQKPILTLQDITIKVIEKNAQLNYQLQDVDKKYQSASVSLYRGEQLISKKELSSANSNDFSLRLDIPDYDIDYRLVTTMNYLDSQAQIQQEILPERIVRIILKKIEFKDVDKVELYYFDGENYQLKTELDDTVGDVNNYFAKISSDRFKEILLPVSQIKETTIDDKASYKVYVAMPELVQDIDESIHSRYVEGFTFNVDKVVNEVNVYTNFTDLLNAMQVNPTGNFVIGRDMQATSLSIDEKSYLNTTFKGNLSGLYNGKYYSISGLTGSLFDNVEEANIHNLILKNVHIANRKSEVGTLATKIKNSTVSDVIVQGNITAQRNIGGLVYFNDNSLITRTAFIGSVEALESSVESNVGGIVGAMASGTIKDSYVDAQINVINDNVNARTGGIVGFTNKPSNKVASKANVENVYAKGKVQSTQNNRQTAGIVGSTYHTNQAYQGVIKDAISEIQVVNGKQIYGNEEIMKDKMQNVRFVTSQAQPVLQSNITAITPQVAHDQLAKMEIYQLAKKELETESIYKVTSYDQLANAKSGYHTAYLNMEKLVPFYNKEFIVEMANRLEVTDKLYTTALISATPLSDVHNANELPNKQNINRLLLHYADNTIETRKINYLQDFAEGKISEYQLGDGEIIYTPNVWQFDYQEIIKQVVDEFQSVDFRSSDILDSIKKSYNDEKELNELLDQLYMEEKFNEVKANIATHLAKVLADNSLYNDGSAASKSYLVNYLKANKEKILLALTYMQRWYAIDFGEYNLGDIMTYHQDFYGKPVNTIDSLISLANGGFSALQIKNNLDTYTQYLSRNTGEKDLLSFLSLNRKLFTNYETDNDWFKATTKAYIVEAASKEVPDEDVRVYTKLSTKRPGDNGIQDQRNGILPLLTAREGIYIITTISTITYGMYDRYIDMRLKETNPSKYAVEKAGVEKAVRDVAQMHARYFDSWYRIVPENIKSRLFRTYPVWDSYNVRNWAVGSGNVWLTLTGANMNDAIKDFFGPVGRAQTTPNGSGAYANGSQVNFVVDSILTEYGTSVFSHEMTHNMDGSIFLSGYGRRQDIGAESFAMGLLEIGRRESESFSLNLAFDYTNLNDFEANRRYINQSPERFQNAQDVQKYLKGVFDIVYLLEYAEAESVIKQGADTVQKWFGVMRQSDRGDEVRSMSIEEAQTINSWSDLLEKSAVALKGLRIDIYGRNNYYTVSMFNTNFNHSINENGAPGGYSFRRNAYELWAAKGYEQGFVPYTSNQLKPKDGRLTDKIVFDYLFENDSIQSYKEFKRAQIQDRIDKKDQLDPVSFVYFKENYTIDSFAKLQNMMDEAVKMDVEKGLINKSGRSSYVHLLKMAIFNAYIQHTDDFKVSIFN